MPYADTLPGYFGDGFDELIHGHVFRRPDIRGLIDRRLHQTPNTVDHVIHVRVRSDRHTIAPHLDLTTILGLGHFSANRCRRLLTATTPRPFRSVAVLEPRNANRDV